MPAENTKRINLNTVIFPITLLAVFTLAYWAIFQKMGIRWSNGDNNYCYLVIPLFVYLLWDKRNKGLKAGRIEDQKLGRLEGEQEKKLEAQGSKLKA